MFARAPFFIQCCHTGADLISSQESSCVCCLLRDPHASLTKGCAFLSHSLLLELSTDPLFSAKAAVERFCTLEAFGDLKETPVAKPLTLRFNRDYSTKGYLFNSFVCVLFVFVTCARGMCLVNKFIGLFLTECWFYSQYVFFSMGEVDFMAVDAGCLGEKPLSWLLW